MVDPHAVVVVQADGISSPNILGVEVVNVDVLDDDILSTSLEP
jgi:hypothetical protein